MKHLSALPFALAPLLLSCAVEPMEAPAEAVAVAAVGGGGDKCAPDLCGMNSPELSDGFFHEMNLQGEANAEGYSMANGRKNGAIYKLDVVAGRLSATYHSGNAGPQLLTGSSLVGLEMRIKRVSPVDGSISWRTLVVDGVARVTDYWAKHPNGTSTPPIETYKLLLRYDSGLTVPLCHNGAAFLDPSDPVRAMPEHHALLFEGERIRVQTLTISTTIEPEWVNFGCAETALAKMQLTGHTRAAQLAGFSTTMSERQAMLKMLTADYCGRGIPFTVAGQRVRWTDDRGTLKVPSTESKVLEARWDAGGALCLNTPRVDAHPTEASRDVFPSGVRWVIANVCSIPACPILAPSAHLQSWNPTPFTN